MGRQQDQVINIAEKRIKTNVSPILAGIGVSLYVSGFLMILILIGSFFKRRMFCNICPLGYLVGLFHKISPFPV